MRTKKKYLLFTPVLFWMILLIVCPLIYIVVLSFLTRGANGNVEFAFTLSNYLRIFDRLYIKIFGWSLLIAFLTTAVTLVIGYPFAYFCARLGKKVRFLVILFVMVPFFTSSLMRTYGWIIILQTEGLLNSFLMFFRIIKEPIRFMNSYGAVLVGTVYMLLPFMILPIYNSVEKLDMSLIEASYDLGASKARTFASVTLPLTLPGIMSGITLVFVPAVGLFFISDLLGGAKTMLLGNLIRNQVTSARDWPFGAALSVIMLCGVLILLLIYGKISKNAEGGLF